VALIFAILLGIGGYILKDTGFGLYLYAVGNNDEAARRAGVKVADRVKVEAFAIAGGISALAGVLGASRALGVGVFSGGGAGAVHCYWNRSPPPSSAASACSAAAALFTRLCWAHWSLEQCRTGST
jgi:ABC-type uncharacterized transport system permease subunit